MSSPVISNIKKHLSRFLLAAAVTVFFFLLYRWSSVSGAVGTIISALKPMLLGLVMAYILRPAAVKLEKLISKIKFLKKAARIISVIITVILALVLVVLFCLMIIPQLNESVMGFVNAVPGQVAGLIEKIRNITQTNEDIAALLDKALKTVEEYLTEWVTTDLPGYVTVIVGNAVSIVTGVVSLFLSICVAVTMLISWESYIAQFKKLFIAVGFKDNVNTAVFSTMHQINHIFNGYIVGKIIDCFIMGILTFISMSILRMPYTLLISIIVGVTNIIPTFGPMIGELIGGFIILLVSPVQALIFIGLLMVLQTIDGDIIGPRLFGNTTGISALYVTASILIFGKLFGFIGMVVGVPVFASIYYIVKQIAESRLAARNLPVKTEDYVSGK